MVSQCLNPACKTPFLFLRDGRLFALQKTPSSGVVEHFWLCGDCVAKFDLQIDENGLPVVVLREWPGRCRYATRVSSPRMIMDLAAVTRRDRRSR